MFQAARLILPWSGLAHGRDTTASGWDLTHWKEETGNPLFDTMLRIGTRGSRLALVQSHWVKERIETTHPEVRAELVTIKTTGDTILDSPLSKVGGKGLFVKEIEEALIQGEIHLAVHSMKDVPAVLPEPLILTAYPEREDPRDALISVRYPSLDRLPAGGRVGTSSLRRSSQILQTKARPAVGVPQGKRGHPPQKARRRPVRRHCPGRCGVEPLRSRPSHYGNPFDVVDASCCGSRRPGDRGEAGRP